MKFQGRSKKRVGVVGVGFDGGPGGGSGGELGGEVGKKREEEREEKGRGLGVSEVWVATAKRWRWME